MTRQTGLLIILALMAIMGTTALPAVEITATVTRIVDGDTIRVQVVEGIAPLAVRLRFIDTPDQPWRGDPSPAAIAAREHLASIIPVGSTVRLYDAGDEITLDRYNRLLALVIHAESGQVANLEQIRAGHSAYWQRFGTACEKHHVSFLVAQNQAVSNQLRLWNTKATWMRARALDHLDEPSNADIERLLPAGAVTP